MPLDPTLTASYDYSLPQELIATAPATPKDSAKLLIYDRKSDKITHTTFRHILEFLPKGCEICLNDTKVIKARLYGKKQSGGKVELLINKPLPNNRFLVMIRGRVKEGTGLLFDRGLEAVVERLQTDGSRIVSFMRKGQDLDFEQVVTLLESIGHIPLPPYMQREDTKADESDYQPLFAQNYGAVAAPTASLHFTDELFAKLQRQFHTNYITLHVGAGTFKPVDAKTITDHPMHSEYFHIDGQTQKLLQSDKELLAVGTTVTRTIEYFARTGRTQGECDLFLHPNNPPVRVNHLLTNFHLPKSTLIMLVAGFVGLKKCLELYEEAIAKRYRFYSYGDAMLIL